MEYDKVCDENSAPSLLLKGSEELDLSDPEKAESLSDRLEAQFQPVILIGRGSD
jgi:hypothetical protein